VKKFQISYLKKLDIFLVVIYYEKEMFFIFSKKIFSKKNSEKARRGAAFFMAFVFLAPFPLVPEDSASPLKTEDPSLLIGLTLDELFARFGAPKLVYALRGQESWQDDVAFMYADFNAYIFKDRVWQVEVKEAFGVKTGDSRAGVKKKLDELTQGKSTHFDTAIIFSFPSKTWTLLMRINFDQAGDNGKVQAVFIYRADI
jgi:hypothetical protein